MTDSTKNRWIYTPTLRIHILIDCLACVVYHKGPHQVLIVLLSNFVK